MPCPVNQGKHPFYDHRWITTAGTYTETGAHDSDWSARGGVLICEMRANPKANARLIAAAPDLLEVAIMVKAYFERPNALHGIEDPCWHAARAAIAKATTPAA